MPVYSASYDTTTRVISVLVCLLAVLAAGLTQSIAIGTLLVAVVLASFAFSPRGYTVAGRSVIIRRPGYNVEFPLEGLREVRPATPDDLRGTIRLWGSGGLFGYYGLFRTRALGKTTWYVTNRHKVVIVRTDSKTALFSPDDAEGFVSTIRATSPALPAAGPVPFVEPAASAYAGSKVGILIGVAVGAVALAFVLAAMLYSPGAPSYTLTRDELAIHDRFYPVTLKAGSVDVDQIRVVDLSADPSWQPTSRTNGFSNSHYHSGWYRVAGGKTVRLYQTDSRRLVLLPPKSSGAPPVLLEVLDPEAFIEQVRREWSGHSTSWRAPRYHPSLEAQRERT